MHESARNGRADAAPRGAWGVVLFMVIAFVLPILLLGGGAIANDRMDDFGEHWSVERFVSATARPSPPAFPDPPITHEHLDHWLLVMDIDRRTGEAIRQLHRGMAAEYEAMWMRTMERHRDGTHAIDPPHEALPLRRDADDTELNRFMRASEAWKEQFLEDLELLLPAEHGEAWERVIRVKWRQELVPYALFDHQPAPLLSDVVAETMARMERDARAPAERLVRAYHAALDPHLESVDRLHREIGGHIPEYTRLVGMVGRHLGQHLDAAGLTPEEFRESLNRINLRIYALTNELIGAYRGIHRVNEEYAALLCDALPEGARAKIRDVIRPIPSVDSNEHSPLRELLLEGRFVRALVVLGGDTPLLDLDPRARTAISEENTMNTGYGAGWLEPRRRVPPLTEEQRQLLRPVIDQHAEHVRALLGLDESAGVPVVPIHGGRRQTNLLVPEGVFMMIADTPVRRADASGTDHQGLYGGEASARQLIEVEAEAMRRLRETLTLEQRMAVARF